MLHSASDLESTPIDQEELTWEYTDFETLGVMGRQFNDTAQYYNRLPKEAHGVVRDKVWGLSEMSTGMFVAFVTNATAIGVQYNLTGDTAAVIMC